MADIRVPQMELNRQDAALRAELLEAAERVLTSAWFIMGPEGRALEEELAATSGAGTGGGLNSAPAARGGAPAAPRPARRHGAHRGDRAAPRPCCDRRRRPGGGRHVGGPAGGG